MMFLLNIFTYIIIGFLLEMPVQSLIFILAYPPLRIFAGGYHAKTPTACYFLGIPLFISVLLLQRIAVIHSLPFMALGIIAAIIIARIAPVGSPAKPLEDIEVRVYRKITRLHLKVEIGIALALYVARQTMVAMAVAVPMIMLAGVLVMGSMHNARQILKRKDVC